MPLIAIVNQKGGVGKTTLATNLACAFADCEPTLLLDCDPQRSATAWYSMNAHDRSRLRIAQANPRNLANQARDGRTYFDWTVIDGPPGITQTNSQAIRAADLVVIPCKPRVWDLWACEDIVSAIQRRQQTARGQPAATFVISMSRPRTRFSSGIDSALARLDLPILNARTTERESYAVAASAGTTVLDGKDPTASRQITNIASEIKEICHDVHPTPRRRRRPGTPQQLS